MNVLRLKKTKITLAILILILSVGLRLHAPTADLPSHISFSGSILTDEGNQCHNSRSKALYNEWFPDDWRITNYNPILPLIKLAFFKTLGTGMLQLRLVNHVFAALSLLFFFLTLRSYFRGRYLFPLLGTLLLGCNFLYIMYNKIATFETSITFWVILTLYFLEKYRAAQETNQKSMFLFLCGAAVFMAFIFKSIMAYVLPLPFAAYFLMLPATPGQSRPPLPHILRDLLLILAGVLVLALPWYFFHYAPNREWIISSPGQFMSKLMLPRDLDHAVSNFLSFPWKDQLYKMPVAWLGAVLYIPLFLRRLWAKKIHFTDMGYVLFFLAHTAVFSVMSYRPTRYFVPVIPAMVFMTILLFSHWFSHSRVLPREQRPPTTRWRGASLFLADTAWLALAAYYCLIPLWSRYIHPLSHPSLSVYYFIAAAVSVAFLYLVNHFYRKFIWKRFNFKPLLVPLVILLTAFSLTVNLGYYFSWNKTKTHGVRDISRELGKRLKNAYIGGMTAPVAVLENRHRTLWLYPDFVNWDEHTFDKYPMTHALLGTDMSREIHHFFDMWPDRMNHAALLKVYPLKDYFLHLYEFNRPYIAADAGMEEKKHRLTVVNPGNTSLKTRINTIVPSPDGGFAVGTGEATFTLAPGQTEHGISPPVSAADDPDDDQDDDPDQDTGWVVFYLDLPNPLGNDLLRYEGENFPGKTGKNRFLAEASNGSVRYFDRQADGPGFLSYGPGVPYAPGFLVADFHLTFKNSATKIKPLCEVDIYSQNLGGPAARREIRPTHIKEAARQNRPGVYRLSTLIERTDRLEFRVRVEKQSDVIFDYVDVTYYQGHVVKAKK